MYPSRQASVPRWAARSTRLTKYQARNEPATPIEFDVPLEVTVENRPLAFKRAGKKIALDIRLLMGRQWLRLMERIDADLKNGYIRAYGISKPNPAIEADAHLCAHSRVWQQFSAVGEPEEHPGCAVTRPGPPLP